MSTQGPAAPGRLPFADVWRRFLREYASAVAYWYVPKARVISDENIGELRSILGILEEEEFADRQWDVYTQYDLVQRLTNEGITDPYVTSGTQVDTAALSRIIKVLLEFLGLAYVEASGHITLTEVGAELVTAPDPNLVITRQVAKYQYPNPTLNSSYRNEFTGVLPHLFLLQVLVRCRCYVTLTEFDLFVNLARSHDDLGKIVQWIETWRDMSTHHQNQLTTALRTNPRTDNRHRRIRQNASYQAAMYAFPWYLDVGSDPEGTRSIRCIDAELVEEIISEQLGSLAIQEFLSEEDWIAYLGDPEALPDWYTLAARRIEAAVDEEEAAEVVSDLEERLSENEAEEIERKQVEKAIEDFYAVNLDLLEPGLTLVESGRQYQTSIGRMDLLCQDSNGTYVVVEIKAGEAENGVFGQVMRYVGWVDRNLEGGTGNVRAILLAGSFSEKAKYTRIGMGIGRHSNIKEFLKFKKHGMTLTDE